MGRRSMFWLVLALSICLAGADEFTNPPNSATDLSITYTIGNTVTVSWNCSLSYVTLVVSHWGGNAVGVLLSDALNGGVYTWTIGQNDNIDNSVISADPNFVLLISDPSGQTTTGDGFVNGQLQSRAFLIKGNVSSSSTTSTSSLSTGSTSTISIVSLTSTKTSASPSSTSSMSASSTASSIITISVASPTTTKTSSGLSLGAKIGVGVGVGVGSVVIIALSALFIVFLIRKRRTIRVREATIPSVLGVHPISEPPKDDHKLPSSIPTVLSAPHMAYSQVGTADLAAPQIAELGQGK